MATASLIPVSEYLSSCYEPDCDFLDGVLQERNVGERPHSFLQTIVAAMFNANRHGWRVVAGTEMRLQVAARRFRIPDVCVQRSSDPDESVVTTPPLICIEVLSPEDRIGRVQEKLADYANMGVDHIWLLDPLAEKAWVATPDGSLQHVESELTVPDTPIRISLAQIFAELDDMRTPRP